MHVITGKITRDVYTKEGQNSNGSWKMYSIDLSELVKDRKTGEKSYTNYRATIFAKAEGQINFYNNVLVVGSIIQVSSEKLKVLTREGSDGTQYISLEMVDARINFAAEGGGAVNSNSQQSAENQKPKPQASNQKNFDDGIPF